MAVMIHGETDGGRTGSAVVRGRRERRGQSGRWAGQTSLVAGVGCGATEGGRFLPVVRTSRSTEEAVSTGQPARVLGSMFGKNGETGCCRGT